MSNFLVKKKKLVIFGLEDFADIAYEYFTVDSGYEVAAFTVDSAYLQVESRFGLPVVAFENLETRFPPSDHDFFAAVVYSDLNRLRQTVCHRATTKGYHLASYVSSRAFVWRNAVLGQHCFVFENNTIQPFARIDDNVVLWCANQISHHAHIASHCFLSGNVAVGGWATVEKHCFIGLNSTLANNTHVGTASWISHGACLSGIISPGSFVAAGTGCVVPLDEARLFSSLRRASQTRMFYNKDDG